MLVECTKVYPGWLMESLELFQYVAVIVGAIVIPHLIRKFNLERDRIRLAFEIAQGFIQKVPVEKRREFTRILNDPAFQTMMDASRDPLEEHPTYGSDADKVISLLNQMNFLCMAVDKRIADDAIMRAAMIDMVIYAWKTAEPFIERERTLSGAHQAWVYLESAAKRWHQSENA